MSKKIMLIPLALIGAAVLALPAGSSAQEIHITGVTAFSGTSNGGTFTAKEEPTITCEGPNHVTGTVNAGGTTGTGEVDLTGCHTILLGATIKCRTAGSALDNTIKTTNTSHLITISNKPAMLVTGTVASVICGGLSTINVSGNVIATITSPACGVASNTITVKASASGATQEHQVYTGINYHPTAQTGSGTTKEAGVTAEGTVASATAGTLECT